MFFCLFISVWYEHQSLFINRSFCILLFLKIIQIIVAKIVMYFISYLRYFVVKEILIVQDGEKVTTDNLILD